MIAIKIVLDDSRVIDCKKYRYNRVKTYSDCILLMEIFKDDLKFVSLDYHLGEDSPYSGYDVLVYMYENRIHPKHINIHSDHETGAEKMYKFAKEHFPNSHITRNKIL